MSRGDNMNLIFWNRLIGVLVIMTFILSIIFGNRNINWIDWISGVACAIAIYYLEPVFSKHIRGRKFLRR